MKEFLFEAWYRYSDNQKDFWEGSIEADDLISAEKELKNKDRRIFKIIWK